MNKRNKYNTTRTWSLWRGSGPDKAVKHRLPAIVRPGLQYNTIFNLKTKRKIILCELRDTMDATKHIKK